MPRKNKDQELKSWISAKSGYIFDILFKMKELDRRIVVISTSSEEAEKTAREKYKAADTIIFHGPITILI